MDQNANGTEGKKVIFEAFCDYCRLHKLPAVTSDTFWKRLPEFISREESYETVNGKRVHCLKGWKLRAQQDWGKHEDNDQDKNTETSAQTEHPEQSVQPVQRVQGLAYFTSSPLHCTEKMER
jgi:hypothetical protein